MEFQFLKKTRVIVLITFLPMVCGLTIAAPVGTTCDATMYSYCNETTSSPQINETLIRLITEADEILSQIANVCKEINVSHCIIYPYNSLYVLFYCVGL